MYEMTEEQRNMLLYIFDHITVTGPVQGGMLNNAAGIIQTLKSHPEEKEKTGEK